MNSTIKKSAILLTIFCSFLMTSCDNQISEKEGLVSVELVGDLKHVQYWDHNDNWDLSSLSLKLNYSDGSNELISAVNSSTTYTFDPVSPEGLDHSITSFSVTSGTYTDSKGSKYNVPSRVFEGISIVDYPYKNEPVNTKKIVLIVSIPVLLVLIIGFFTLLKKKKSQ